MSIETIFDPTHWHEWRRTGIGASDAAVVSGQVNRPTRVELWLEKIGKAGPRPEPNEAMRWGHRLEDDIADAYTEATGIAIRQTQVACRSDDRPWMIATLDGIADDRLVEFKATGHWASRALGESGDVESLPLHWILQAQHQMAVYGTDLVDFAVFLPTLELRTYPVQRSDLLIDSLAELEWDFWECVRTAIPPPNLEPGDHESLLRYHGNHETRITLDDEMVGVIDRYVEDGIAMKLLEQSREEGRARIIAALGHHKYGDMPDGRTVTASVANISERTQVVKAHTQVRLSVKAPRPEHVNVD